MKIFYFSGTGNTELLALASADFFKEEAKSVEQYTQVVTDNEDIMLLYPVYGSAPPLIMREWVKKYLKPEKETRVFVIVSQMMFSGDGAMSIGAYMDKNLKIVHAAHINMPNNIGNMPPIRIASPGMIRRKTFRALKKLYKELLRIKEGRYRKKGSSDFWHNIGEKQRGPFLKKEDEMRKKVYVDDSCIACGKCVKNCPVENFVIDNGKAKPLSKCTLCMRCMYLCPHGSIAVLSHKKANVVFKALTFEEVLKYKK